MLVVKTHNRNPMFTKNRLPRRILHDMPVFGAAVLLIRNPRDAMIAEWHRERSKRLITPNESNHVLHVGKEYFGKQSFYACMFYFHVTHACVGSLSIKHKITIITGTQ